MLDLLTKSSTLNVSKSGTFSPPIGSTCTDWVPEGTIYGSVSLSLVGKYHFKNYTIIIKIMIEVIIIMNI